MFLLLEMGVVGAVVELLGLELEQGRGVYEGTRANITIADNLNLRGKICTLCDNPKALSHLTQSSLLRFFPSAAPPSPPPLPSSLLPHPFLAVVLSLLYVIMETVSRHQDMKDNPDHWKQLKGSFLMELELPCRGGEETLASTLFNMLLFFCNGSMPHYPIKKVLLLIWKCVVTLMGGLGALNEIKKINRVKAGLPPDFPEDTPTEPLVLPMPNYDPRLMGAVWVWFVCRI